MCVPACTAMKSTTSSYCWWEFDVYKGVITTGKCHTSRYERSSLVRTTSYEQQYVAAPQPAPHRMEFNFSHDRCCLGAYVRISIWYQIKHARGRSSVFSRRVQLSSTYHRPLHSRALHSAREEQQQYYMHLFCSRYSVSTAVY